MWNTWQLKKEFMFACFPLIYFSKPDQYAVPPHPLPNSPSAPPPSRTDEVEHWSCTKMHTAGEKPKRRRQRWKYAQGRHILLSRLDYKTARRQQQQAEPVVVGARVEDGDVVGVALLPFCWWCCWWHAALGPPSKWQDTPRDRMIPRQRDSKERRRRQGGRVVETEGQRDSPTRHCDVSAQCKTCQVNINEICGTVTRSGTVSLYCCTQPKKRKKKKEKQIAQAIAKYLQQIVER